MHGETIKCQQIGVEEAKAGARHLDGDDTARSPMTRIYRRQRGQVKLCGTVSFGRGSLGTVTGI